MLLDCCCMPDVARHEMDKSFESYRCFTVVGRKYIYYYLPKIMKKSLVMIVQMSDVLLEQPQKPIEKHQACNNNPVA